MNRRNLLSLVALLLVACSATAVVAGNPLDRTQLPIGNGKLSFTAKAGYVMRCGPSGGGGGAGKAGPWIKADGTFDLTAKLAVQGSVNWPAQFSLNLQGSTQNLSSNGLPNHPTGTYPVAASDPAYQYDRNPNSIQAKNYAFALPANPTVAAQPSCLKPGPIAVLLTGAVVFDGLDAESRDAVANEVQDSCGGHPEVTGTYHYHNLSSCLGDTGTGHSALMGYAMDGFGLYGVRGENGKVLANAELDVCHGHVHQIAWNGTTQSLYHYHATYEFPYTLSCFKGTRIPG